MEQGQQAEADTTEDEDQHAEVMQQENKVKEDLLSVTSKVEELKSVGLKEIDKKSVKSYKSLVDAKDKKISQDERMREI